MGFGKGTITAASMDRAIGYGPYVVRHRFHISRIQSLIVGPRSKRIGGPSASLALLQTIPTIWSDTAAFDLALPAIVKSASIPT